MSDVFVAHVVGLIAFILLLLVIHVAHEKERDRCEAALRNEVDRLDKRLRDRNGSIGQQLGIFISPERIEMISKSSGTLSVATGEPFYGFLVRCPDITGHDLEVLSLIRTYKLGKLAPLTPGRPLEGG